jgi:hypothetical protein
MTRGDFRADLHCHSTCSDGSFTPIELVRHAHDIGLSALAITDHDNCTAYGEALAEAERLGVQLLTGVEFSTHCDDSSIHILGYGFPPQSIEIAGLAERHRQRRHVRNRAIFEQLARKGITFTAEEIDRCCCGMNGRPHIAQLMVAKGYVPTIVDAFKRYLADGASCFVKGDTIATEETIELIHRAKGLAVLAHPHLIKGKGLVRKLLAMSFDGIECYYAKFPMSNHKRWLDIARQKGWLITGGSDFHGDIKPMLPLGSSWVGMEHFKPLWDHFCASASH